MCTLSALKKFDLKGENSNGSIYYYLWLFRIWFSILIKLALLYFILVLLLGVVSNPLILRFDINIHSYMYVHIFKGQILKGQEKGSQLFNTCVDSNSFFLFYSLKILSFISFFTDIKIFLDSPLTKGLTLWVMTFNVHEKSVNWKYDIMLNGKTLFRNIVFFLFCHWFMSQIRFLCFEALYNILNHI